MAPIDPDTLLDPSAHGVAMQDAPSVDSPDHNDGLPNASALQDRLPLWFRTSWAFPASAALIGLVYLYLSYQPLWHTDIWGHLSYGRYLAAQGLDALHGTEPLMPLAEGVEFVDTAWLSQLVGYGAYRLFGVVSMQFLYAVSITFCVAMLTARFYSRTGSFLASWLGVAAFLWVDFQQLIVMRPQLAGLACFVALFAILTARRWYAAYWAAVPMVFVLWANLHGSFIVGLALLAAFCGGHALDIFRRTLSVRSIVASRRVQRLFLLTQLAAVAVLINPYGLRLYTDVLAFGENPNLRDLLEWEPLSLRMKQGQAAFAIALALVFLYRFSPRRVRMPEVLLLVGLGAATLWHSRMLIWWGPIAAYYVARHFAALWGRYRGGLTRQAERPRTSLWTVVGLVSIWICFAPTHFALRLLHGKTPEFSDLKPEERVDRPLDPRAPVSRSMRNMLAPSTPVDAVQHLNEMAASGTLPPGLVFNEYEWGDYLLWAGPEGLPIFVASHLQFIPPTVWGHYRHVIEVGDGYEGTLDRYGVNLILLDRAYRSALVRRLRRDESWRVEFESPRGIIFVRKQPI